MAVKKKTPAANDKTVRKAKPRSVRAKRSREAVTELADATARLHELVLRCAALREGGQHSQARKLLARVEKLQKALQGMEEAIRRATSGVRPLK
jgi:hypothetical protein